MANNIVDIKSIGSLLSGKNCFYVPCYQRGYRWNRKQVEELLSDLYSFRKQYDNNSSEVGSFYCLQPIIVREICDKEIRTNVLGEDADNAEIKIWELIDGQQRLTSIFILLSYLIYKEYSGKVDDFKQDHHGAQLYRMFYESRPSTCDILNALAKGEKIEPKDIDSTHICNSMGYIDEWFNGEKGLEINKRYNGGEGESTRKMRNSLLEQITNISDKGQTKIIWYQLSNDEGTDPVLEFTRTNSGKIPLTDTELVKAILLQKKNFVSSSKVVEQAKVSLQWEQMENMLHCNDFWCFISNKGIDEEDRMGELLKLVYLKLGDKKEKDIESGDIFRFYYAKLDGLSSKGLQEEIAKLWTSITDTFNTLQDWYDTPEIYNYVGYLIQSGMTLTEIYKQYENIKKENPESTTEDFISLLESDIKKILPNNCAEQQKDEKPRIVTKYPDRINLRKILLLLNVDMLSRQLKEIKETSIGGDANVFKFPYNLYRSQNWDIEHIDSATTNRLTDKESQKNWVEGNIKDYNITVTEEMQKKMDNGEWVDLIGIIQNQEDEDKEDTDFIGNLTLLDASTNREYGNALFRKKRQHIIEKAKHGRYILPCTQYVFMKFFDSDNITESRNRWTKEDKEKYHDFIFEQLKRFLPLNQN